MNTKFIERDMERDTQREDMENKQENDTNDYSVKEDSPVVDEKIPMDFSTRGTVNSHQMDISQKNPGHIMSNDALASSPRCTDGTPEVRRKRARPSCSVATSSSADSKSAQNSPQRHPSPSPRPSSPPPLSPPTHPPPNTSFAATCTFSIYNILKRARPPAPPFPWRASPAAEAGSPGRWVPGGGLGAAGEKEAGEAGPGTRRTTGAPGAPGGGGVEGRGGLQAGRAVGMEGCGMFPCMGDFSTATLPLTGKRFCYRSWKFGNRL